MITSRLMIVQGGGPTAVFNASLSALVAEAQRDGAFGAIYGARNGVQGMIAGELIDLTSLTIPQLDLLARTPGAALGSSRHSPSPQEYEALLDTLERLHIGALVFMGGNGTMRGACLVSEQCVTRGLAVRVVGVPKTVDNDLATTDRCPGYASAARYAASVSRELAADIRSLPQPVSILETLGRNVGWIAAATALAHHRLSNEDAPQLIYIPEVPFAEDMFLGRLEDAVRRTGWAQVVVAEGIRYADGTLVHQSTASGQADPLRRPMTGGVARHLAQLIGERLGMRCRSEIPGLLGRAAMPYVSTRDREDAVAVGIDAARALMEGRHNVMVALLPIDRGEPTRTTLVDLAHSSGAERAIPADWLCDAPVPVTEAFLQYVRPLVGPLDEHITALGPVIKL